MSKSKKNAFRHMLTIPIIVSICVLILAIVLFPIIKSVTISENNFIANKSFIQSAQINQTYDGSEKATDGEINYSLIQKPKENDLIAVITLPNGQNTNIFHGENSLTLSSGGVTTSKQVIGESGCVIYGYNHDSIFGSLKNIDINQTVKINTYYGSFKYTVIATETLQSEAQINTTKFGDNVMAICTDFPFETGLNNDILAVYMVKSSGPDIVR